ncbi:MAG: LIC_13387 family protein [Candidatus Acidiferrales bacterium]
MRAWIWLRITSIVVLVFALGHGFGHLHLDSSPPEAEGVFHAMKGAHFQVMGSNRTVWDFYSGFSVNAFISAVLLGVLIWLLGNLARTEPKVVRPFVIIILIAQLFYTLVCWTNFFAAPAIFNTLATLLLGAAALAL